MSRCMSHSKLIRKRETLEKNLHSQVSSVPLSFQSHFQKNLDLTKYIVLRLIMQTTSNSVLHYPSEVYCQLHRHLQLSSWHCSLVIPLYQSHHSKANLHIGYMSVASRLPIEMSKIKCKAYVTKCIKNVRQKIQDQIQGGMVYIHYIVT